MKKYRRQLSLLVVLAGVIVLGFQATPVWAANDSVKVTSTVTVRKDGSSTVKHTITVVGPLSKTAEIPLYGSGNPSGLTATGSNNQKLRVSYTSDKVVVDIPEDRRNNNKAWTFTVNYSVQQLTDLGRVQAMQLPMFETNLGVTSQTQTVAADLELGFAATRGRPAKNSKVGVGQQILTYENKKGPIDSSATILFGNATAVNLTYNATLKNNGFWWKDVTLTLPPDTNQQQVVLNSIEPSPSNIRLDRDGNMLASWRLRPLGQVDVNVSLTLNISSLTYDITEGTSLDQIDQLYIDRYTKLTDNWQPADIQIEEGLTADSLVSTIFHEVVDQSKQNYGAGDQLVVSDRSSSLAVSDKLVGTLRANGVPARVVLGLVKTDGSRLLDRPKQHAWVEAYTPGVGWMTLDPWLAAAGGDYGSSDPMHIGLGLWGIEDDRPPVPLDAVNVEYIDEMATVTPVTEREYAIKGTKHVILPFVSIMSSSLTMPSGTIADDLMLKNEKGDTYQLGSLAPMQTITFRSLKLGGVAMSGEVVNALLEGSESVLAETYSTVSYGPIMVELAVALLIIMIVMIIKRRGPKKDRFKPSKESLTLHDEAFGGGIEEENLLGPQHQFDSRQPQPPHPSPVNRIPSATIKAGEKTGPQTFRSQTKPTNQSPNGHPYQRLVQ